jgi:hypothetical protein
VSTPGKNFFGSLNPSKTGKMRRWIKKIDENLEKIATNNDDFKPLPSLLQLIQRKKDQMAMRSDHYLSLTLDTY